MKNFSILIIATFFAVSSSAATITAVTSTLFPGDWASGSTWSSGTVPTNGDLVIIPLGLGVEVGSQVYSGAPPTLSIEVSGTLHFRPSGKLDLSITSYLQTFLGGKIIPQNTSSSQLVEIGGVTKYNAANNGILLGPAYANAVSGSSRPGLPLSGFDMGVLPVQLEFFSAKDLSGTTVLQWKTAKEYETYFFEVEKSVDEGRTWHVLNKTLANGTSSIYTATDPSQTAGAILYRLKTVDKNGSFSYSSILKINRRTAFGLFVAPNPSTGNFTIALSASDNYGASISLVSFGGQTIKTIDCQPGRDQYKLDVQDVPRGAYLIALYKADVLMAKQTVIID